MELQKLLSYTRRAVQLYDMIDECDRIAVGVSGGKDSLALTAALASLKRFYPKKFEVEAISVDLGFDGTDFEKATSFCESIGIRHTIVKTDIGEIIFERRKEKNPCSLCAKMRKGALNSKAEELNCTKIALGHNRDDVIETYFMSLFYEGRIYCFSPVTYLDRMKLTAIRPLIYVPEASIEDYAHSQNLPIVKNLCPADGNTKRQEIKEFVSKYRKIYSDFDSKIFGAIERDIWNKRKI